MSNRRSSENSDSVSLFPFLAVLLCTMGALLVLLVIFVERAAKQAAIAAANQTQSVPVASGGDASQIRSLRQQLAELAGYQAQLDQLRTAAAQQVRSEQLRLSHSEEQIRHKEQELARLAIAAQQLELTEQQQTVDQDAAEAEMARLEKLVEDTSKQLDQMQQESAGKHSYAIIPYKGPNGTYRKPIYLECTGKGVIIHPEGIQLSEADFAVSRWPGNPLASALRASREYLNQQAAQRGETEPPDPYPLLIVRPSGIDNYLAAREAITSWDSDYGYEFIAEETPLSFLEGPDPQLAQAQQHALMIARDRLVQLAQAAPRRFRGVSWGGKGMGGGGGSPAGSGWGDGTGSGEGLAEGAGNELAGPTAAAGGNSPGSGGTSGGSTTGDATPGDTQFGNLTAAGGSDPARAGGQGEGTGSARTASGGGNSPAAAAGPDLGPRYAQRGGSPGGQQTSGDATGGQLSASAAPQQGAQADNAAGQMGSAPGSAENSDIPPDQATPSLMFSHQNDKSIAETRGANWAVQQAGPKSVAIRRTIHAVVRENQIAFLPSPADAAGPVSADQLIALDGPQDQIASHIVTSLRQHITDWGLAGSGMYWRPVLELRVGPEAEMTAARLVHLLHDSGVEVQLPSTARASAPATAVPGRTVR